MSFRDNKLTDSPFILLTLSALAVLIVFGWIFQQQQQAIVETRTDHYGNSLATMAADQAKQFAIHNDLVSLQVLAEELVALPDIDQATIYDVEGQPLVQAGDGLNNTGSINEFSSPISFNDSLAGHVYLRVNDRELMASHSKTWYLAVIAVLIVSLILQLAGNRDSLSKNKTIKDNDSITDDKEKQEPTHLILEIQNIDPSLSSWTRLNQCGDFLCKLYNGRVINVTPGSLALAFDIEHTGESVFNIICSGILARQLGGGDIGYCLIRYASRDSITHEQQLVEGATNAVSALPRNGLVIPTEVVNSFVSTKLRANLPDERHESSNSDNYQWLPIDCLQSKYADLIAKQQTQLQRLGNN